MASNQGAQRSFCRPRGFERRCGHLGERVELYLVLLEQVDRALVRLGDDGVDLVVDELRRLLRVRAVQRLVVVLPEGERPDRLGHAEDGHLLVRHVRDALHHAHVMYIR